MLWRRGDPLEAKKLNLTAENVLRVLRVGAGLTARVAGGHVVIELANAQQHSPSKLQFVKVTGVESDYLECVWWDPVGADAYGAVNVAKPFAARGGGGSYAADDILRVAKGTTGVTVSGNAVLYEDVSGGGSGDVIGPALAGDREVAFYDGTTGKLLGHNASDQRVTLSTGATLELGTSDVGGARGVIIHNGDETPGSYYPAFLRLYDADGIAYTIFVTTTGKLQIHTAFPTSNSDGTVVGTQS